VRHILGAMLALSLAAPAAAKDIVFVTTSSVSDKPQVSLDPAQAYVLVRADAPTALHLMRMPNAEDQAAYDKLRAEALAKAREKYAKKRAAYERAKAAAAKAKGNASLPVPPEPIEPTESNFEFTAFGLMAGVPIGPTYRFAKQDGGFSTYLQAVTPGRYRIYGPIAVFGSQGVVGSCLCMGSVAFEAKVGEITDLGTMLVKPQQDAAADADPVRVAVTAFRIQPATAETPVDPRLKAMTIRPAAYRPVGKLPNYFGVAIDRLPEIPGVMRYDRDRIIDLTAQD